MVNYRCFLLSPDHRIADFVWLECADEATALSRARDLLIERKPAGLEIWDGPRLIARLQSGDLTNQPTD